MDQDQTERALLLTETGYYNAGSQEEMTYYNTKSITKLGITAFEIIYIHIQRVN